MLGFGALHRLPAPLTEPPQAPGETLFDYTAPGQSGSYLFPPTELAFTVSATPHYPISAPPSLTAPQALGFIIPQQTTPTPPLPQKGISARHKPRHAHHMNVSAMDAYMREGEQKSQEQDFPRRVGSPAVSGVGNIPPPPRGSLPPPPRRIQTPLAGVISRYPPSGTPS